MLHHHRHTRAHTNNHRSTGLQPPKAFLHHNHYHCLTIISLLSPNLLIFPLLPHPPSNTPPHGKLIAKLVSRDTGCIRNKYAPIPVLFHFVDHKITPAELQKQEYKVFSTLKGWKTKTLIVSPSWVACLCCTSKKKQWTVKQVSWAHYSDQRTEVISQGAIKISGMPPAVCTKGSLHSNVHVAGAANHFHDKYST